MLVLNLPAQPIVLRPFPPRKLWVRRLFTAAHVAMFALAAIVPAFAIVAQLRQQRAGTDPVRRAWRGVYRVESFSRAGVSDTVLADDERWIRVGIETWGPLTIQRADGSTVRQRIDVDAAHHNVRITRRGDAGQIVLSYKEPEPGVLEFAGPFAGPPIEVRLRRLDDFNPAHHARVPLDQRVPLQPLNQAKKGTGYFFQKKGTGWFWKK